MQIENRKLDGNGRFLVNPPGNLGRCPVADNRFPDGDYLLEESGLTTMRVRIIQAVL